jgi:hypothetical protein
MADDVAITAGAGTNIRTNQQASGSHVQVVQPSYGTDTAGTNTLVDTPAGMPVQLQRPTTAQLLSASINAAASGDNALIAAVAAKTSRVMKLFLIAKAPVDIKFRDGTTDLDGVISLQAGGSITLDFDGEPWFVTSVNTAFNLNLSAAVQVSGRIYYSQS